MRLSRPCYDKPRRCPGWAGGGMKYAKVTRCSDGSIHLKRQWLWNWRFGHCNDCDVVTWPYIIRWTSPRYLAYRLRYAPFDLHQWWDLKMWQLKNRRGNR